MHTVTTAGFVGAVCSAAVVGTGLHNIVGVSVGSRRVPRSGGYSVLIVIDRGLAFSDVEDSPSIVSEKLPVDLVYRLILRSFGLQ